MSLFKKDKPASPEKGVSEPSEKPQTKVGYLRLHGSEARPISSWLPGGLVESMDRRVARCEYRSTSEYVLAACRHYEDHLRRKRPK